MLFFNYTDVVWYVPPYKQTNEHEKVKPVKKEKGQIKISIKNSAIH